MAALGLQHFEPHESNPMELSGIGLMDLLRVRSH
jgi:hypothetical protein